MSLASDIRYHYYSANFGTSRRNSCLIVQGFKILQSGKLCSVILEGELWLV